MKKVFFLLASAAASLVIAQQQSDPAASFFSLSDVGIVLAVAATAVGCGLAQAKAIRAALEGIARQPEASGRISGPLLGLGFIFWKPLAKFMDAGPPFSLGLFLFILVSNLLGLVPGLLSPTANLNTTAALALISFASTHFFGIRKQGFFKYLAHF